jgi:hypothetical protein
MPGNNSNLSTIDRQQVTAAATAKKKEDDATTAAQATAATAHWGQEALIAVVPATHKILDEAQTRKRAAALTWENEKTITHHLEEQLAIAHGIMILQDDDDDLSINADNNCDAALTAHLHAQAVGL